MNKPNVRGIVIFGVLRGVMTLGIGLWWLNETRNPSARIPDFFPIIFLIMIIVGAILIFGAWQIRGYKVRGLQITAAVLLADILVGVIFSLGSQQLTAFVPLIIDGLVLYYAYKYLSNPTYREFFT